MRLVVQSPAIQFQHLVHIHQISQSNQGAQFIQIAEHAYYLPHQESASQAVIDFCAAQNIDCAYVPEKQTLNNIKLAVMDMDSTLINIECIDEIADMMNIKPQVAAITESAMRGELDFSQSLRARVETLTGLPESVIESTYARITLTEGAKELIAAIHARGGKAAAVSGGFNQLLEPLAKRLGLDFWRANQLEILEHTLTGEVVGDIIDRPAKASALAEWAGELGLTASATIAVGDGANDLDMLSVAALGVAFNAKPKVRASADVVVDRQDLRELIPLLP